MTEWQQLCHDLAAIPNQGERRWHILNRQQQQENAMKHPDIPLDITEYFTPDSEPTTLGVLIDNDTAEPEPEEGPEPSEDEMSITEKVALTQAEQDEASRLFDKIIEAARWRLFHAHPEAERPIGEDTGYIPPAHRWLPVVEQAVAKLAEAEEAALKEIPRTITRELYAASFRGDGMSTQLDRGDPEVQRYSLIQTLRVFAREVAQRLANEGRPRPARPWERPGWKGLQEHAGFEHLRPQAALREDHLLTQAVKRESREDSRLLQEKP